MNNSIYISNFDECQPASALAQRWEDDCWRTVPYETVDGIVGTMLMTTTLIDAPPVSLPLNLKGCYRIYLGLGCPTLDASTSASVKVRLTDDPCYSVFQVTGRYWWMEFQEIYWRETDLTGQTLQIAKPKGMHNGGPMQIQSYISYLRLEPLSDEEAEAIQKRRNEPTNFNIFGTEDGWSVVAIDNQTTLEELYEPIFPYKDSDVRTILYNAAAGDYVNYPDTKVGTAAWVSDRPIYSRPLDKAWDQSMEELRTKQIDPVGALCDFTHSLGLEFHGTVRIGSFACEPPMDESFKTDFYNAHPEFRCKDIDGREIPRLSYAFPEVQQHMLDLYCEIAERNIDGFGWIYIRSLPVILYEDPLIDGFMQKYDLDPRELPEDDVRVVNFRSEIFTDFIRKAETTLNDLRIKQGRAPLKYSAIVPATKKVNQLGGLDLQTWVEEGLIDILAVDFSIQDRNALHNEAPENMELDYFQEIVKGTNCILAPRLAYFEDERGAKMINSLDNRGIHNGLIWDTANCFRYAPHIWPMVKEFGSREKVSVWAANATKPERVIKSLKMLGGFTMDKFPGNLAY